MKIEMQEAGLQFTAETSHEVLELIKHFNLDVITNVEAIAAGSLSHLSKHGGRDNRAWFAVSTHLGVEWLKPYTDRLAYVTGYTGPIPKIDPAPRYSHDWLLCHTHTVTQARIDETGYHFDGFKNASDWNGKAAAVNAADYFTDYCRESLGERHHEPEYIGVGYGGGGLLKRNPNYLKRHPVKPTLHNHLVFGELLQWWLNSEATTGQIEVATKAFACHKTVCKSDELGAWMLREYSGWRTAWDGVGSLVTFKEFAELK